MFFSELQVTTSNCNKKLQLQLWKKITYISYFFEVFFFQGWMILQHCDNDYSSLQKNTIKDKTNLYYFH